MRDFEAVRVALLHGSDRNGARNSTVEWNYALRFLRAIGFIVRKDCELICALAHNL